MGVVVCGFLGFSFLFLLVFSRFRKNFRGGARWQVESVEAVLLWVTSITPKTQSVTHTRSCPSSVAGPGLKPDGSALRLVPRTSFLFKLDFLFFAYTWQSLGLTPGSVRGDHFWRCSQDPGSARDRNWVGCTRETSTLSTALSR